MEGIFHFVLTASLYAAVVGLVIILVKWVLRNRLSAEWHYLLWMVLILKLLIPFGPESAVSLFNTVPEIPQPGMSGIAYQVEPRQVVSPAVENPPTLQPSGQKQDGASKTAVLAESMLPCAWAAGAAFTLLWLVFTYCSLQRKLHRGSLVTDERVLLIFDACRSKTGIDGSACIPLIIQDAVGTPSLFGVMSPKILLPPAVLGLSDKELEYILLHELAHYKRKDVLANYLLLALQTVHWFNPVIWYCFRRTRQDMEAATDQRVLSVLESSEHKDYGRALLAVLEGFAAPRLAPRLLGMVDDRKNMERRLNMIRMAGFFRSRRRLVMAVGLLCLAVLGSVLLTSGLTGKDPMSGSAAGTVSYDAEALFKYKTPYVGDNSRVVSIINNLPFAEMRREVSLQTQSPPYGATVDYDFSGVEQDIQRVESIFRDNAAVMFALIDNVDVITFSVRGGVQPDEYRYTRAEAQKGYDRDLREYSKDVGTLGTLIKSLSFRLYVQPEKYALIMSSTPGIRITAEYRGPAARARYSAEGGVFLTWDDTGKVSKGAPTVELPLDTQVYWSPLDQDDQVFVDSETPVTVTILDEPGQKIDEKRMTILYDGELYYTVQPEAGIVVGGETPYYRPMDLDEAVSMAVKSRSGSYAAGETATEGHIILDSEESGGTVRVYTIASCGAFGFENRVFTKISGSGAIPTVMTFSRDENGGYSLLEYREPMDGAGYTDSIKKMFPPKLQDRVLSPPQGDDAYLVRQQEEQAAEYLGGIGRTAKISASHVKKRLVDINVNASNKLFAEYTKFDSFLNNCPYWIGTRERIENGVRFIYETSQEKTSDGYDLVVFRKAREDGRVVEERQYRIVGSEPELAS